MRRKVRPEKRTTKKRSELAMHLLHELRGHVHAGQRIGVAVSGGADSVALLYLLLEIREPLGIVLFVLHFNHQLRGKASRADEAFVMRLAALHGLPFFSGNENVAARSKRDGANLEDTARRARYAFFARVAEQERLDKVAVAHTAEDQAETVLAHILRGTGIAGLGGIHPEAGVVFRPLLGFHREELRKYLRARRQDWREDRTNRDMKRMRARIRYKLLPFLEKKFSADAVGHLCQLASLAREDDAWLESSAELRLFLSAKEEKGAWCVPLRELIPPQVQEGKAEDGHAQLTRRAPEAMSKRLIRRLVKRVKPRSGQLSAVHVEAVLRLAVKAEGGKSLRLPGGVEVRRERHWLAFRAMGDREDSDTATKNYAFPVDLSSGLALVRLVEHSVALRFRVIDWPREGRETKCTGAVLDRGCLSAPLVVRNWQPGDTVHLHGHQKRHRLSRLLNEAGVSRWDKRSWPVLTSGGRIAWARGLAVAAEFAAGASTRAGVVIEEVPLT
jgi:tRNA(Ile)-lysidine synthase